MFLDNELHKGCVRRLLDIIMLRVIMRNQRSVAAFGFLDILSTRFTRNLGGRFRTGEVAEEAMSKSLVVVDHDRLLRVRWARPL